MSEYDEKGGILISKCSKLEDWLKKLGGTGRGLKELRESVKDKLTPEAERKIRNIAHIRNLYAHPEGGGPTLSQIEHALGELKTILPEPPRPVPSNDQVHESFWRAALNFMSPASSLKESARRTVTFTWEDARGRNVFVAGCFTRWIPNLKLERDRRGVYTANILLAPGEYQYKFIVDGEWRTDKNNPNQVPNGFGGVNSLLRVTDK